jgi:hypothetical protein
MAALEPTQPQTMAQALRTPLSPSNAPHQARDMKQTAASPSVNPLALKADWAPTSAPAVGDEEDEDPLMAKVGSPRPKKGRRPARAAGAARVGELLAAAAISETEYGGVACLEPSVITGATRCQIARRRGVYTLLDANGRVLLSAKHSLTGKWTVSDGRGNYVGKAATRAVDGTLYKFKRGDGACVGGMLFAPNKINASLPPELRLAVPPAPMASKELVACLRKRDYGACPTMLSKPVRWDGSGYVLDFPEDLPIIPSAKNFQLAPWGGAGVALQLARVDRDTYCLEYAAPLSPFVAFCGGLASVHSYNIFQ